MGLCYRTSDAFTNSLSTDHTMPGVETRWVIDVKKWKLVNLIRFTSTSSLLTPHMLKIAFVINLRSSSHALGWQSCNWAHRSLGVNLISSRRTLARCSSTFPRRGHAKGFTYIRARSWKQRRRDHHVTLVHCLWMDVLCLCPIHDTLWIFSVFVC